MANLTINQAANWRLYTNVLPAGCRPLGTVTKGCDTGALALVEATGLYVQVNAGTVRMLDQRKVKEALTRRQI